MSFRKDQQQGVLIKRLRSLPLSGDAMAELAACLLDGVIEALDSQVACCFSLDFDVDGSHSLGELYFINQRKRNFLRRSDVDRDQDNHELADLLRTRLLPVLSANWAPCFIRPSRMGLVELPPFALSDNLLCFPLFLNGYPHAALVISSSSSSVDAEFSNVEQWLRPILSAASDYIRAANTPAVKCLPERATKHEIWHELEVLRSSVDCAIIGLDINHRISSVNLFGETILRVKAGELCGTSIVDIIPARTFSDLLANLATRDGVDSELAESPAQVFRQEIKLRRTDGSTFLANLALYQPLAGGESVLRLVIRDIDEISAPVGEETNAFRRFRAISDLAPVGIFQTNLQWSCTYINERWSEITGLSWREAMGMGWVQSLDPKQSSKILENLRKSLVSGKEFCAEVPLQTVQGERVWVELNMRPLTNEHGMADGFLGTYTNVTFRKNTENKLRILAERDSLTGLANREVFQNRLHMLNRGRRNTALVLLYIGVDAFRLVNESMGHDSGDEVLAQVAARLCENVRSDDLVSRFGGDEFTILLDGIEDSRAASRIAENLRARVAEPLILDESEIYVSISIGVAMALPDRDDISKRLSQATVAFRRAKERGKNTVEFYTSNLKTFEMEHLHLGNSLHRALEREEMRLHYQPQVDVKSGKVVGLEALLRWQHPTRGLVPPVEFISLLEHTGLINPVGDWVLEEACNQYIQLRENGVLDCDSTMSVNISPRQLRRRYFVERIERVLRVTGMPVEALVIEITESVLFDDAGSAGMVLGRLQQLGIKIALDDFGTGYSSLTYLKQFPIDILKVDKSFVIDMLLSSADTAITKGVIALAKSLNIIVVAEGVENEETLAFLREQGCDHYQGFYFAKPRPAEELSFVTPSNGKISVLGSESEQA